MAPTGSPPPVPGGDVSYAKTLSVGLVGVTGHLVEVEADLANGLPAVVLSGLPDTALTEARDRVRAAIVNSGQKWPSRRITVNLLPAALPKFGSGFDLAIAAAMLAGAGELPLAPLQAVALIGELGLDGTVRPVRGVLPMVAAAARAASRASSCRSPTPGRRLWCRVCASGQPIRCTGSSRSCGAAATSSIPSSTRPPHRPPDPTSPMSPDRSSVAAPSRSPRRAATTSLSSDRRGGQDDAGRAPAVAAARSSTTRRRSKSPRCTRSPGAPPGTPLLRRPPFQAPHHTPTVPSPAAAVLAGSAGCDLARPPRGALPRRGGRVQRPGAWRRCANPWRMKDESNSHIGLANSINSSRGILNRVRK